MINWLVRGSLFSKISVILENPGFKQALITNLLASVVDFYYILRFNLYFSAKLKKCVYLKILIFVASFCSVYL